MTNPGLRASDDERRLVVAALERHAAAGRLTLDEFGERVTQVLAAATHGDLSAITRDLPVEPVAPKATEAQARQLAIAFALAVLTLILIGVVLAVFR